MLTRCLQVLTTTALGLMVAAGFAVSSGCSSEEKKPAAPPPVQKEQPPPPAPEPPKPSPEDIQLQSAIDAALQKAKLTGVTVTVMNGEATVKGTVPKGKKAAVLAAVGSAKPKKVNSTELMEQ
ncbi:MAG: hypothetical protein SNJ67_07155 [Chloracidobacterium sp.]|uniref:BON domain-containing protein n=1 Tax=Chloracidobacterium validum TaxID=2821543 RepID=A0ABX8BEJ3_9BACT|nr:hypothetical protein [Chloracidobacterium validum]QUW04315.1 hypothetical protein J8C06_14880 [Chloracidobacterium validum]